MGSMMNTTLRMFGNIALFGLAVGLAGSALAADSACKGVSKSQCVSKDSCSWVEGYTTKKGVKVSAYCRAKSAKSQGTGEANKSSKAQGGDKGTKKSTDKAQGGDKSTKKSTKKTNTDKTNTDS